MIPFLQTMECMSILANKFVYSQFPPPMLLSKVSFEAVLLGVKIIVTDEEKCSTPVIPVGGKNTHDRHKLALENQLSKKDQAQPHALTWKISQLWK